MNMSERVLRPRRRRPSRRFEELVEDDWEEYDGPETESDSEVEIPVLTLQDIHNQLLQEALERETAAANVRPFWVKVTDALIISLFHVVLLRIIKNLLSMTSFSRDIMKDTEEFVSGVMNRTLGIQEGAPTTLIMKFHTILCQEFPSLQSYPNFMILTTLMSFYGYALVASLFVTISFVFSMLCMSHSLGRRWTIFQTFIIGLFKEDSGVF